MKRTYYLIGLALLLVFGGGFIAYLGQTSGNTITVRDVRFIGTNGIEMSALLYIPDGVTNENPAPGILAIHGYINSRETQDGFAIEFARRGYVVLALDQTGHGYSDPPAVDIPLGFGGPDGLAYLHSLDIVDKDNIGISGHSMGGWATVAAAAAHPDMYKASLLEGSSTGQPWPGTADFPRNMGLIFSTWDEFAAPMWGADAFYSDVNQGVSVASDIVNTPKLETDFGTTDPVEVGKLYGSIADGTARMLYMPQNTHPGDHISTVAIADAIDWFSQTLDGSNGLDPYDQVWYWRELGGFAALCGMILFMFPVGVLLLDLPFFKELADPLPEFRGLKGGGWWIGAALLVFIPVITYFWLQNRGYELIPVSSLWPQQITTGIAVWALGNGIIAAVLFLLWHYFLNRRNDASFDNYGVTWEHAFNWRKIGKSALLAIAIVVPAYALLLICGQLYTIDFRLWVLAFKGMDSLQFGIMLAYLPFFVVFFLVLSTVLGGEMRRVTGEGKEPLSLGRAMLINGVMLAVGIVILLLIQYIPLMTGGTMPLAEPLLSIVAFQFVPLLFIVGLLLTYFFRKTGRIYTGAFLCALLISWYIVAGQAIHFAF